MDVHKFLVLPGSKIVVVNDDREVVVEVLQEFEAQATKTVQIRANRELNLDFSGDAC